MPAAASSSAAAGVERPQALPQHLAALAEGGRRHALQRCLVGRMQRLGARRDLQNGRCHLRRRGEGAGRDVEQAPHLAQPLHEHAETAVILAARRRRQPVRDLLLEHQRQAGDGADIGKPAQQQGRGDIVGQVGDDAARGGAERGNLHRQGIRHHECEPAGKSRGDLLEHRPAAFIPFHRHQMRGTVFKQGAGQAAGAGSDLDDRAPGRDRRRRGQCARSD